MVALIHCKQIKARVPSKTPQKLGDLFGLDLDRDMYVKPFFGVL